MAGKTPDYDKKIQDIELLLKAQKEINKRFGERIDKLSEDFRDLKSKLESKPAEPKEEKRGFFS